jgi:hypothetical protein
MTDYQLIDEYIRTLGNVEHTFGWQRRLQLRYRLKELHAEIVKRGLEV